VIEHLLQTVQADQVRAAADADDLDADVFFDAVEAHGALGVGGIGGVSVREEVGVGRDETLSAREMLIHCHWDVVRWWGCACWGCVEFGGGFSGLDGRNQVGS
jgi:hypothetical protein